MSTAGVLLIGWAGLIGLLVVWLWLRGAGTATAEEDPWAIAEAERRAGRDRRRLDIGPPPGRAERRSGFDRRAAPA